MESLRKSITEDITVDNKTLLCLTESSIRDASTKGPNMIDFDDYMEIEL